MLRVLFATLLLGGLLLSVPAQAALSLAQANQRMVDDHLLPAYQRLAETTRALALQADALCAAPDAAQLADTRQAYQQAMDAWMGIQHLRFGPVELLLRYHRYQLWPDKRNTGAKQLAQLLTAEDAELLQAERFEQSSVAVQGFSALERLLFGARLSAADFAGYRCAFSRAVAHNLATMSAEIVAEWNSGDVPYRALMLQVGRGNDSFESDREVTSRLLNNLDTQLQVIVEQKLLRPLDGDVAHARPRRAESWRSQRSLRNIALNLAALQELYLTGFSPLLLERPAGVALDARLRSAFTEALAAARAIDRPLLEIGRDPAQRPALDRLLAKCRDLKALTGGALPQALDIPLGFNSLDGD